MVALGYMDPSRCELGKGLPIPALGHRECWALELQRLGSSEDVQGPHSLRTNGTPVPGDPRAEGG